MPRVVRAAAQALAVVFARSWAATVYSAALICPWQSLNPGVDIEMFAGGASMRNRCTRWQGVPGYPSSVSGSVHAGL